MKKAVRSIALILLFICLSFSFSIVTAAAEPTWVYLGGAPIGIGLAEDGLIVTGIVDVITDDGAVCPAREGEIATGDVIIAANDVQIDTVRDLATELQRADGAVLLTVKRGEETRIVALTPAIDSLTGLKKLGITVKNGINGIGTLTYVTSDMRFGALGHGIVDADTGKTFVTDQGSVYSCTITGYRKAVTEKAGELVGRFDDRGAPIGEIDVCNAFGVYGMLKEGALRDPVKISVAPRSAVRPGKAYVYSTIEGSQPQKYEIEIVKVRSQDRPEEKSMLIKVVDPALLDKTGGILQGMSGSPIVQNDKLVGAVTHVLVNDSALGYGLYLDWMLPNN